MKTLSHLISQPISQHWVGDGFPVRTLFDYGHWGEALSPFLLFDYAGPRQFAPTTQRLGVGEHPHRGFETVTLVYDGELEHRDSTGSGGKIGAGDVQWMTAGSGVVHEELHSTAFGKRGGRFEVVQLWVNLPAKNKMTAPRYQGITSKNIPNIPVYSDKQVQIGTARLIAGEWHDGKTHVHGAAQTFSPIKVWDITIFDDRHKDAFLLPLEEGHSAAITVLNGGVQCAETSLQPSQVAILSHEGAGVLLHTQGAAKILVLSGAPLHEPIAGRGPFVMNTHDEIHQAIRDYQSGKMGHLT